MWNCVSWLACNWEWRALPVLGNRVSLWVRRKCVGLEWMVPDSDEHTSPFPGLNCSHSAYSCDMLHERNYLGGAWILLWDHFLIFSPFPCPCWLWRESRGSLWLHMGAVGCIDCQHLCFNLNWRCCLFLVPRRRPGVMVPQGESHTLNLSLV